MKGKKTYLITGIRLKWIRAGVALTLLKVAFKMNRNPLKVFGLIHKLIKERLNIHDNAGEIKAVKSGSRVYWSINMPGWPSENFYHFIKNEFIRMNSPDQSHLQTIIFAITNICPLKCAHCYESENITGENKLSPEDLKLIMRKIHDNGIRHIQFNGGEPLNRFDDMIELMDISDNSCDFWINTSGFGLTKEKARVMKQKGMTGAVISLDHWDEARHNAFRNNDLSFYWVKEAVKNCNDAGIIVCLSICPVKEFVSEENLNQYHLLAMSLGAMFIRILEPRKVGRFSDQDIMLEPFQIEIIDKFAMSRNKDSIYNSYPIIQFPGHHQRKSGCLGAGNRYIYIDSNGDYHSCPFCRKSLGSAISDPIETGIMRAKASGCQLFKQSIIQ